jgi:hypothetical protein
VRFRNDINIERDERFRDRFRWGDGRVVFCVTTLGIRRRGSFFLEVWSIPAMVW